jgi:translation initiation factor IF-2
LALKRLQQLAKELGITHKVIIQKCLDEGVPADKVKNHMSQISAGLEASIREWFSAGTVATAVETTEHVDVEKIKSTTPRAKKARKAGDDSNGEAEQPPAPTPPAETAVETAPRTAPVRVEVPPELARTSTPADAPPTRTKPKTAAESTATPAAEEPEETHVKATPLAPAARAATPPTAPATGAGTAASPGTPGTPGTPAARPTGPIGTTPAKPVLGPKVISPAAAAPAAETRDAAAGNAGTSPASGPGDASGTGPGTGSGPSTGPGGGPNVGPGSGQGHRPAAPRPTVRPAPMNIPQRPTSVQPVGQRLEVQQVKLAGPRVVRIEAAESLPTPAPRRAGPSGGPPRTGRGPGTSGPAGPGDADRTGRNTRRTGTDAAKPRRRGPGGATGNESELALGTGFSEADLAEREERLARATGLLKKRRREAKAREQAHGERALSAADTGGTVQIVAPFTIKDLSETTGVKAADIIKKLFLQGVMATINSGIDTAKAQEIMIDFDIELEVVEAKTAEQKVEAQFSERKTIDLQPRAPIVTIMGHVDHGKTSLLDAIRKTNVAAGEAGGITQRTSAFKVAIEVGGQQKHVVFIDTPGHEAFTEMRSRGANMTDVVVLVVGAPEGVMPQTVESINHAKAAKVPIVVALNKIDSPQATENQIQKIYGQLNEHGLNPVEWGGQIEVIKTSAVKGTGIKELLEILDLQAQLLEMKADTKGNARGRVVEAGRDEGRGPLATVMVQEGELSVGNFIVAGRAFGRVRDITDDQGKKIKTAGPSTPVQVSGLDEVPSAGDAFFITETLKQAQEAAEQRRQRDRAESLHQPKVTLDSFFSQMKDANVKEILIVLKADVQGSVDVIRNQIEKLSSGEVKVRVLHAAVGGIQESDVLLADASKAVIVGFNVIPSGKARTLADNKSVEVRTYQVIYDIIDDVKKAASGMLEPEIRQEILGHAEVRQVFKVTRVGTIAGCYVTDGLVQRDALIRVTRQGVVIENDRVLEQLKRFKDDAKDVKSGMECGMKIVGYDDIKEGDVLECYKKVEVKRTL